MKQATLRRLSTLTIVAVVAALTTILTFSFAAPASAAARTGVCPSGQRLGRYSYSQPAYNSDGDKMWSITWIKRWCYSTLKRKVTSYYSPTPTVKIYSYFDLAWKNGGTAAHDAYYTSVDATGVKHPKFPQWGHLEKWTILMKHCALKWALCTNHYYTVGTIGYWDGSKKIVYGAS